MDKEPIINPENKSVTFDDLKTAAQEENWEFVDSNIAEHCDNPKNIDWALNAEKGGINDKDGNIRDLAVSLVEKSSCKLSEQNIIDLTDLLKNDENIYVKYRSAFALFTHGDRSQKVIEKIKKALEDENVKEIAENYLSQIS